MQNKTQVCENTSDIAFTYGSAGVELEFDDTGLTLADGDELVLCVMNGIEKVFEKRLT